MALLERESASPGRDQELSKGVGPLKILQLKKDSSEVEILTDNLNQISRNLKRSGAAYVSIISVMGTYRTGKSFLLDLLMRYLKKRVAEEARAAELEAARAAEAAAAAAAAGGNESPSRAPLSPARNAESEAVKAQDSDLSPEAVKAVDDTDVAPEDTAPVEKEEPPACPDGPVWRFEEESDEKPPPPAWVLEGNAARIAEGSKTDDKQEGFAWRPGKDKCTQGIWLWGTPFVFKDKDGRRVAVLLMDTQGAWDDTMTKAQSATIFGLTALLSSKLIYNIQNRVEEDKLENMDYITTFAQTVCSDLPGNHAPFGHLELLVRDWANYEAGFTVPQCKGQMAEHLDDHLNAEKVPADAVDRVERLKSTFRSIGCFGLPHPGLKVTKPSFTGEIDAIDPDFLYLLDQFTQSFFGADFPQPSAPLGCEVTVGSFEQIVMNFAEAFRENAQDMAIGLREAFVKVEMMTCREELIKRFREQMLRIAPDSAVLDPDELQRDMEKLKSNLRQEFATKLKPFKIKEPDEENYVNDFTMTITEVINARAAVNKQQVEGATVKLLASPVVGGAAYFLLAHQWFLYMVMGAGGYLHAKKCATRREAEVYDPAVIQAVADESREFLMQRYKDIQAMQVALVRLNPNNAMETIMQATQQAGVVAATAAAAASSAAAAANNGQPQARDVAFSNR